MRRIAYALFALAMIIFPCVGAIAAEVTPADASGTDAVSSGDVGPYIFPTIVSETDLERMGMDYYDDGLLYDYDYEYDNGYGGNYYPADSSDYGAEQSASGGAGLLSAAAGGASGLAFYSANKRSYKRAGAGTVYSLDSNSSLKLVSCTDKRINTKVTVERGYYRSNAPRP